MGGKWREFAYQVRGKGHVLDGNPVKIGSGTHPLTASKCSALPTVLVQLTHSEHGAQAVVSAGCDFLAALSLLVRQQFSPLMAGPC